ncbi:hypothetical protein H4R18_004526 [Coemansia javaensis]|uniref:Uncharacterized protein n=1 Tax=Coemansia javaensis TaxID=2761396 RepID=A0A9W8HBZ5_9FUNG|nr:hypothetical protein H4R18_004526 [Coemansia javaensis]
MRDAPPDYDDGRCTPAECIGFRSLLQRTCHGPRRPQPGERIPRPALRLSPQPVLHSADAQFESLRAGGGPRQVKFCLPPQPQHGDNPSGSTASMDEVDSAEETASVNALRVYSMKKFRVQSIPPECIHEMDELGALRRILVVYRRSMVGQLAIDRFRPLRTLYFYSLVLHHLHRSRTVSREEVARVCEAAAVLNNAVVPRAAGGTGGTDAAPSLLKFLDLSIDGSGRPAIPAADYSALASAKAHEAYQRRMLWAMECSRIITGADGFYERCCIAGLVQGRFIIRPVFDYMYRWYLKSLERDARPPPRSMQFSIYTIVAQSLRETYDTVLPAANAMYVVMFAIAVINGAVADEVARDLGPGEPLNLVPFFDAAGTEHDPTTSSDSLDVDARTHLANEEVVTLLDLEFAAAVGYMLADQYLCENQQTSRERARLGALAQGVVLREGKEPAPRQPLLDSDLHRFVKGHVEAVYSSWSHAFVYMVLDEAVEFYNTLLLKLRADMEL